jgi:hypothetical protein
VRRHETDAVSLAAGLLFLVVAAVHVAARSTGTDLSLRWMVPAVLVLLGVLGLLGAVRAPRRGAADVAEPADHAQAAGPGEVDASVRPAPPFEPTASTDDADTAVLDSATAVPDRASEASPER